MRINKILIVKIMLSVVLLFIGGILGAFTVYANGESENIIKGSGGCPLSEILKANESPVYDVYLPQAKSTIVPIQQAPRLTTLNGKTIAIVGGSFMASVTHPEIKRLILKNYPDAKVILLNEIGSAGPYPAPGVVRQQKEEFQRKLKEMKVDAVISGNGGCGLCTPKEEGSCIAAEYIGIPSVMIAAPGFVEQAKSTAYTAGVSVQRVAQYPGAFSSHTHDELIKNTKEILWQQIVDGLTKPITQDEISENANQFGKQSDSKTFSGTYEEIQQYFENHGLTDGVPISLPTQDRVDEFLKYTPYSKDSVIGTIPPSYNQVTAQQVAVVGAMAGCPPEYMPILVAYTKAMTNGDFRKTLYSTHAWTPFVWINGPISRQLGIDSGQGEISSPNNKKIGRFIDLAMINLGGYDIKKNRMGTFGYLSSWSMAEDEQSTISIGWSPYHVQKGYDVNDNTITAASSLSWGNNLTPATSDPEKILELMAWDAVEKEQFALGGGTPFVYRTIFITEYVAKDLAKKYKTKDALEDALVKTARRPVEERTYANFYANPGSSFDGKNYSLNQHQNKISQEENAQTTATPNWLAWTGKTQLETVPVMQKGKTAIVITGDANRNKVLTVPGGGMATVKIELPNNWDSLVTNLGYKPLSSFYLSAPSVVKYTEVQPEPQEINADMPSRQYYKKTTTFNSNINGQASGQNKRPSPERYRQILNERKNNGSQYKNSYQNRQNVNSQYSKRRYQSR